MTCPTCDDYRRIRLLDDHGPVEVPLHHPQAVRQRAPIALCPECCACPECGRDTYFRADDPDGDVLGCVSCGHVEAVDRLCFGCHLRLGEHWAGREVYCDMCAVGLVCLVQPLIRDTEPMEVV